MSARTRLAFAIAALGLGVALTLVAGRGRADVTSRVLEVDMRTSAGTVAQVFWASDAPFVEQRSIQVPLQRTPDGFQRLRFSLPGQAIRLIRFDPTDAAGELSIRSMRLLDAKGQILATLNPESLRAGGQIASVTTQDDLTRVTTTAGATDPFLLLPFGCQDRPPFLYSLSLFTPTALALATVLAVVLLGACGAVIGYAALRRRQDAEPPVAPGPHARVAVLWLALLFLLVFSAKLLLMRDTPVTAPFWDQWDGEASVLFVPYSECNLTWRAMFGFHNEHRVFFTRLLALDLLVANGQWDPRLEQVVNAAIHSLTAVLLAIILWHASERRRLDFLVFICAVIFALPFGWENSLIGFQSAFYFLLLFSILALWLTTRYRAGTGPWVLGWLCAVCGLFTAASGVLIAVVIPAVVALKSLGDRRGWREVMVNGGAAALVLALGFAVASPPLAHHAVLKARTAADFAGALARGLSWPFIDRPRLWVVMWLPLAAALAAALLRRLRTSLLEQFVVGLSIWVVLQAGAIAYGRGAGAPIPATRYFDFLSLVFVANAMALVALLDRARAGTVARYLTLGTLVGWLLFAVVGVDALLNRTMTELGVWRQHFSAQASSVRRFMIIGDLAEFIARPPGIELPYPDPHRLATLLQDPYIRSILPAAVRQPLRVEARLVTNSAFVMEGPFAGSIPRDPLARSWWSLSNEGRRARGRFESQPMRCGAGRRLGFQVSGYLGWPHQYLAVKDLGTGQDLKVNPFRVARDGWTQASVPCPSGPFEIVGIDEASDSWFGFREPVEVGWASLMAESLIGSSRALLLVALAMTVLAARWT